jgi:hypothetical protein
MQINPEIEHPDRQQSLAEAPVASAREKAMHVEGNACSYV